MIAEHKNLWVVVNPVGLPFLVTNAKTRKGSIEAFVKAFRFPLEWKRAKEEGWTCVKVNITVLPVKL